MPSRSDDEKARSSRSIFPASAHSRTRSLAAIATTWMRAPVSISPPILGSPILPAPTTRHRFPDSFINIGNRLVTVSSRCSRYRASHTYRRQIAGYCFHRLARQKLPPLRVRAAGKQHSPVLGGGTGGKLLPEQSLDSVRELRRSAAITHCARRLR